MKLPKKVDKALWKVYVRKNWKKCMFGYVVHSDYFTVRIYIKDRGKNK